MALAAGMTLRKGAQTVRNLSIQEALILSEGTGRSLQLVLIPDNEGNAEFKILSFEDEQASSWKLHATGQVSSGDVTVNTEIPSLIELQSQPRDALSIADYYQQLQESGLNYGESFQCIVGMWVDAQNRDVLGQLRIGEAEARGYNLFPGLIDACFQLLGAMLPADDSELYLPVMIEQFQFNGAATTELWAYATIGDHHNLNQETLVCDLQLFDLSGHVVGALKGLRLKRASRQTLERLMLPTYDDWLYEVEWTQKSFSTLDGSASGNWLILSDQGGLGLKLAAQLKAHGADRCDLIFANSSDIDRQQPETYASVLNRAEYQGIVYLWALNMQIPTDEVNTEPSVHLLHLVQGIAKQGERAQRLWVITRNAHRIATESVVSLEQSPLWGLGRVISLEHPNLWGGLIDLDLESSAGTLSQAILQPEGETQIAIRSNQSYVARLAHKVKKETNLSGMAVELVITNPGILENLTLLPLSRRKPGAGEIEVQVRASGLNFRDVLNALGMYPGIAPLGNECSGLVVGLGEGVTEFAIGDEVIALGSGTFKSYVTTTADQVFHKPANLTFAEAVSVPTTFLTAAFGLLRLAQIQPGQRVLIHSAAGGVGLAAVQLMQRAGAEIFATAGSTEKRAFLKSIGVEHVMNSRTLDFAQEVMSITKGEGVDVVLNSLSDEFIGKNLSVLAEGGTFLEIGKRGIWEAEQVAAAYPTLSYHVYDLVTVLNDDPDLIWSLLHQLLADFANGNLKALPTQEFSIDQAVDAFRFMAQAKHVGKVVIMHELQNGMENVIHANATYLITGGLGGLGLTYSRLDD